MDHVRPKALTTALAYAAWARRGNQEAGLGTVQQLIENQIDPAQPEPSLAVRWVCGASFSVLAGLFRPWAKEKASVIFPLGEAERRLWTAAWDGYLDRWPDLDMCDVLTAPTSWPSTRWTLPATTGPSSPGQPASGSTSSSGTGTAA